MSRTVVVRYQTRPDAAEENERLIAAVFAALADERPAGLQYTAYRLEDGVSFVHVAVVEGDENPLLALPAFNEFVSGVGARAVEGPVSATAKTVGSYG